jgi:hypothetical protein
MRLSDEATAVLERSVIDGTTLRLPGAQLPRKLYEEVNEVLARLGGKWTRKVGGHVFPADPSDAVRMAVESGELPPKNPLAFFPTPAPVCGRLAELADPRLSGTRPLVLEPSAGRGDIAVAIRAHRADAEIHAVEIDVARAAELTLRGVASFVAVADFLKTEPPALFYDVVAMNPPFTAPGDPLAYITHIYRAWQYVAEDGVLVAVAPNGFTTRSDRRCREFRDFVEANGEWESLPVNAFKDSGTGVSCVLIRLQN